MGMWWRRRRRTPIWVWVLALLGVRSLWSWGQSGRDPQWQQKRQEFRTKMDEAFGVWRDDTHGDEQKSAQDPETSQD